MTLRLWRGLMAGSVACAVAVLAASAQAGGGGQVLPSARKPASKAVAKPKPESALVGTWEVTRVLPDLADQPHWSMRPNDASLLYRSMTIAEDKIWFVGDDESCDQPRWQSVSTTWQGLFQKTGMVRAPSSYGSTRATPADYDLKVASNARVQAFLVCPAAKKSGRWYDAGWLALESPDSLIVRYSQQLLVALRRRPKDEAPRASFPCEKASSPAEKTICSDVELAAWDRSVAEALRRVLDFKEGDEKARVLREHMAWKGERDRCATDRECLEQAMGSRTRYLIQE